MSYDGSGTGILGRSSGRLGRFGLGRIPKSALIFPCPYRPSHLADAPLRNTAALFSAAVTPSFPQEGPGSADSRGTMAPDLPILPILVRTTQVDAPLRATTTYTAAPQPASVIDTVAAAASTSQANIPVAAADSPSLPQEPTVVADTEITQPIPTADSLPPRITECR